MNSEENRLQTFSNWPSDAVVDSSRIAKAGFFYTKNNLTVECFSCHVQISEWNYGDQVMAKHRALRPDCAFVMNPLLSENIPIGLPSQSSSSYAPNAYSTEEQRLATFTDWPKPHILTPERLAHSGFYYLRREDRTKCAFCNGVVMDWLQGDDPDVEHKRHFPKCSFVLNTITPRLRRNIDFEPNAELGINRHQGPKHPQYGTIESRLATFHTWPPELIQTPDVLADAGFYYEGLGDQVRCFHCDGGLRHWDPSDDPWTEHARWFGSCAFVRLVKGGDFVNSCSINLNGDYNIRRNDTTAPRRVVSDQEIQEHLRSEAALKALSIGLNIERVKQAIKDRLERSGRPYLNPDALVEAALSLQHDEEDSVTETDDSYSAVSYRYGSAVRDPSCAGIRPHVVKKRESSDEEDEKKEEPKPTPSVNKNDGDKKGTTLEEENRLLKEARLCKICMDVEVGIVFLPCGHLTTCVNCAANLEVCPVCRSAIKATVRTFLS